MPNLLPLARRALLGLATALPRACSVPAGAGPLVDAVDSITITVSDLERSLPFFEDVLSFERVSDVEVAGEAPARSMAAPSSIRMPSRPRSRARSSSASRPRSMATLKGGRVEQSNFDTYQMLRINEAPVIEVHIVQSSEPRGGMGEPGTSAIAPAITISWRM